MNYHSGYAGGRDDRRRDGSQASKAKSNKTVDYECVFMRQFDPVYRLDWALAPTRWAQAQTPPLAQYERLCDRVPPLLTRFGNRRKCETKQNTGGRNVTNQTYV